MEVEFHLFLLPFLFLPFSFVFFISFSDGDCNKKEAIGDDGIDVMIRDRSLSDLDRSLFIDGCDFDIFLSFAPADVEFADEMRLRLINRFKRLMKVFLST